MLPTRRGAGALQQARQHGEHRRRVAAGGRRLADRQADLALGHRQAGDRVHHQQHVGALVAEALGDRRGHERRLDAAPAPAGRRWRPRPRCRARPSGPRSCSMNSRTSRPRSPTRAITLTSALVPRAIMPSSVLLPTPEPAKMPRRWPRPHGMRASIARTPSGQRLADRRPARARRAGAASIGRRASTGRGGQAVDRAAEAVEHPAEQAGADVDLQRRRRWRPRSGRGRRRRRRRAA